MSMTRAHNALRGIIRMQCIQIILACVVVVAVALPGVFNLRPTTLTRVLDGLAVVGATAQIALALWVRRYWSSSDPVIASQSRTAADIDRLHRRHGDP